MLTVTCSNTSKTRNIINRNSSAVFMPPSLLKNRCRKHIVFGSVRPRVSECVSLCVFLNLVNSKTNEGNFTELWSQMYMGPQMCWLYFGVKRLKVKVTRKPYEQSTMSQKPIKEISSNFGHIHIWVHRCVY